MSLGELGLLVLVGGSAVLSWRNALRARETAIAVCRRLCRSYELQLLDDTVALCSLRPARSRRFGLALRRVYTFDFSRDGTDRESGSVTIFEGQLETAYLPPLVNRLT